MSDDPDDPLTARAPGCDAENAALSALAAELAGNPEGVFGKLADFARALCGAASAGVGVWPPGPRREVIRPLAVSGRPPSGDVPGPGALTAPWSAAPRAAGLLWTVPQSRPFDGGDERRLHSLAPFAAAAWSLLASRAVDTDHAEILWFDPAGIRPKELNAALLAALQQHRRSRELFAEGAWLRTLLGSLSDGIIAAGSDTRVRYLNAGAERATGWSLAEAMGKPVAEIGTLTRLGGGPVSRSPIDRALAGARPTRWDRYILHRRDGRTLPIEAFASPILEPQTPTVVIAVFRDISEQLQRERRDEKARKLLKEQVNAAEHELGETRADLRALSGRLITLQEEERRRLARELHDDFGQRAAILGLQISRALDLLPNSPSEAADLLARTQGQIVALDNGLREVSHRLHPSVIEDLGLIPGLTSLVEDLREGGAEITLAAPDSIAVPAPIATCLYRVTQEALRNAAKHAPGAPVHIRLSADADNVHLAIEDAGPGFDVREVRAAGGLGLLNMRERARLAGGTLTLRSFPGRGTAITVAIPHGR